MVLAFFGMPGGVIALTMYTIYRIPFLVSSKAQDIPGFCPEEYCYRHMIARPVIRIVWRFAKAIIADSMGQRDLALQAKARAVRYIPNGVDFRNITHKHTYELASRNCANIVYAGSSPSKKSALALREATSNL